MPHVHLLFERIAPLIQDRTSICALRYSFHVQVFRCFLYLIVFLWWLLVSSVMEMSISYALPVTECNTSWAVEFYLVLEALNS